MTLPNTSLSSVPALAASSALPAWSVPGLRIRLAQPGDIAECIRLRGLTRENAIPAERLAELGITLDSWSGQVARGELPGVVAEIVPSDVRGAGNVGDVGEVGEVGKPTPPTAPTGHVAAALAGYCFGDAATGEIVVLALLPQHEGQGLGRVLLQHAMHLLRQQGHTRLFLGCSDNPQHRSHGFYRHLGWVPTGERDGFGDEVLAFSFSASPTSRTR